MKILLTGTSCGIGQKLARSLASQGHEVWGLARTAHDTFRDECRTLQGSFRYSICDISIWPQLERLSQTIAQEWQRLDALIHCAGVQGPIGPARTLDPQAWTSSLAINLNGTFFTLRAMLELLLKAQRRAKVICFSGGG